ncbi:MAG: DinB family protein [Cellvibrionaceae bacterium]
MSDTHLQALIDSNLTTLAAAADLLAGLSAEKYTQIQRPYFESSMGKHLRHILDHYICFKRDFTAGLIDYDQRQRDCQLETDRDYAITIIEQLQDFLINLKSESNAGQSLKILMCNDVAAPEGEITESSLGRELQFLQGHSVHHYALMAAMMRFSGEHIDDHFGVAPSTIVHEETVKESA